MRSYAEKEAIRKLHLVEHKHECGLMWAECSCGWRSRKLDSYHSLQATESARMGRNHVDFEVHNAPIPDDA